MISLHVVFNVLWETVEKAGVAVKEYETSRCLFLTIQNDGVEDVNNDVNQPVVDKEQNVKIKYILGRILVWDTL